METTKIHGCGGDCFQCGCCGDAIPPTSSNTEITSSIIEDIKWVLFGGGDHLLPPIDAAFSHNILFFSWNDDLSFIVTDKDKNKYKISISPLDK